MTMQRRLEKLEAIMRERGLAEQPWLVYALHEWSDAPVAFREHEAEAACAHWEPIVLDNLVVAGKIRECDREHVTFIVRTLVAPTRAEAA